MVGVAEREVVRLDREDVREVVAELEREVELDAALGVVRDDEVLLHPVADEALAGDRDLVVLEVADDRVPQEEGGRVVLDLAARRASSGRAPLTVRTQRERKRVSSAKKPIVGSAMSPSSSETQNVEPSRIVSGTRALGAPGRWRPGSPAGAA